MKIIRKISQNQYNIKNIVHDIETILFNITKKYFPDNWYEETLNLQLLTGLKRILHDSKIQIPGDTISTSLNIYKLVEPSENYIGDIAFIVHNTYHDGDTAEGVTYFKTCLKEQHKNTFTHLRKDHLKRLHSYASHSQLLLYDYDNIANMAFPTTPESIIGNYPHNWSQWLAYTSLAAVQTNLAHELGHKTTALYKVSVPFSYLLCYRLLYGLDIDFTTPALETAKGIRSDKGNPTFIALFSVTHGSTQHDTLELNSDLYKLIS